MSSVIDLFIRKSVLVPFRKRLYIDSKRIEFGDRSLFCHEVKEIRYGIVQMYINGIKANRFYEIGLKAEREKPILIGFQSLRLFFTDKKKENQYLEIIDCLWENITKKLTEEAIQNLEKGRPFKIKNVEVTPQGVKIKIVKWFKKDQDHFVEWKDLRKYSQDGHFHLYSDSNRKVKIRINFQTAWNSPVLASLLETLWQDGRAYALANSQNRF